MIKTILIQFLLLISAIETFSQSDSIRVDKFYAFLGYEKSDVLKETILYFNEFLDTNFDTIKMREDKIHSFLNTILENGFSPKINWKYNPEKNKTIIEKFEKSGLRKDIWIYGKELVEVDTETFKYVENYVKENSIDYKMPDRGYEYADEIIMVDMDSLEIAEQEEKKIRFNNSRIDRDFSLTMFGFDIFPTEDNLIQDYKETKFEKGSTRGARRILIDKILGFDKKNFLDPYFNIILVEDYFYLLVYVNEDNKK